MLSHLRFSLRFSALRTPIGLLPALLGVALLPRPAAAGDDSAPSQPQGSVQVAGAGAQDEAGTANEAGAPDEGLAEARLHFSNGVELLQSSPPNYQDAFPQFLAA